ncbi:hypothetical protein C8Q76DRAFT_797468 [Earliella scabrosa]|nr:hypothetical protein C8Q76DRAFT_797468 [Earliella scabrosa]
MTSIRSLIEAWDARPQVRAQKFRSEDLDEAKGYVLSKEISVDWAQVLVWVLRQEDPTLPPMGSSPVLWTVDKVAYRLTAQPPHLLVYTQIAELTAPTPETAANPRDEPAPEHQAPGSPMDAPNVDVRAPEPPRSPGSWVIGTATDGRKAQVLQVHGFLDPDYEDTAENSGEDLSSDTSEASDDWDIASADSIPEHRAGAQGNRARRGLARRVPLLAPPGAAEWPSDEELHGHAPVALFGRDHRRDAQNGTFFFVPLSAVPVRYLPGREGFKIPADVLAQTFAQSLIGRGGNTYLSIPMLAGGVEWNRPFAAIDARGLIRLAKEAGYVRAVVIPEGVLPEGVPAGDFAVELRLDAPAVPLDHAKWEAEQRKQQPIEIDDSDDDVVLLPGPPRQLSTAVDDEATTRAYLQYVDEFNDGEFKHHPVVAHIRTTAAKHRPTALPRVLEWINVVRDLLDLEFIAELADPTQSEDGQSPAPEGNEQLVVVEPITAEIVGRYLGRRSGWVRECVECHVILTAHEDDAHLAEVLEELKYTPVTVHTLLRSLRAAFP